MWTVNLAFPRWMSSCPSHWRYVFTCYTVCLTGGLCSLSAQSISSGGLCSLEVCIHPVHSPSHWRFMFTGSLYSPSAQSVSLEVCVQWKFVFTQCTVLTGGLCSLEVCVHSVHSSHCRFVFTGRLCSLSAQSVFTHYTVLLTGGMCLLVGNVTRSVSLEEHVHMLHNLPLEVCVHLLHSLSLSRCVLSC